jgi:Tfp pilus assembly protein PilN
VRNALARQSFLTRGVGGVGVLLSVCATFVAVELVGDACKVDSERLAVERKRAVLIAKNQQKIPSPLPALQIRAVNNAIAQLNIPWRELFDAIAATPQEQIAILAVEPDAMRHVVKMLAEAKTGEDMVNFIRSLKRQAFFADANLVRHEVNEQDANRPVRFQLEATFGPIASPGHTDPVEPDPGMRN